MKLLTISHLYPSPGDDRHLFVHDQLLALRALGVQVRVVSPTAWAPRALWHDPRQRRRGLTPRRAELDGVVIDYPRVLSLPRRLLFDRLTDLAGERVRRLPVVRERGIDLVHAHQALPDGAVARRVARDLDVPYMVTVHGADVYQHLRGGGATARHARATLADADAVMAVSSAVAALLAGVVAPGRLTVVANGTSGLGAPVEPARDLLPGEPLVLTVGNLIPRKGTSYLVDAIRRLRAGGRDVHLAIVGEGRLRGPLATQAAALGVSDRVHFLGQQSHERVLALMARAQLFALPSWDEAFGLVYTEAMAQGVPVLATRGEGPAEFIEDGVSGFLAPPRDAAALARIIARVLDEPGLAAAVGSAGRDVAAGFTWRRNAELTLRVYERALAGGGPHG